ncbi:hypothetical protein A7A08_01685 [Methyloligella halotolerans]|uniref:Uncharacterized protein n=1 Tax=Methyloligella halotolerans TaxID=1177755 RepID=A0A1E2RZR5_9HYPH|nr:hypothetical protein [Methyloligella halotolerans]ODA67650.1 hypothetical protein A7A08_01685 [Methyloligella halotolerans]
MIVDALRLYDQECLSNPKTGERGDCTRACVRTLAQCDLEDLPHPVARDGGWNDDFYEALEAAGLVLNFCRCRDGIDYSPLPRVVAAGGPTVRTDPEKGNVTHMVIWDRVAERCLHDPHPSRAGLLSVESFYWLERLEVAA